MFCVAFDDYTVGVLFVVLMQISSCITSSKMQAVVVVFAALYCFGVQIGLVGLEIACKYLNQADKEFKFKGESVNKWNNVFIQPLIFPLITSIFIFRHMLYYYRKLVQEQKIGDQLFFG